MLIIKILRPLPDHIASPPDAQRAEFHRCYINGRQDTLAVWEAGLVYLGFCEVRGGGDFIGGGEPAFLDKTNIKQRRRPAPAARY